MDDHRSSGIVSRRRVLVSLPVLGASLTVPAQLSASECASWDLTTADSLLYYMLLVEDITETRLKSISGSLDDRCKECDRVLKSVQSDLSKLKTIVSARRRTSGTSRLEDLIRTLEAKYDMVEQHHGKDMDPRLVTALFSSGSGYAEWIREAAYECEPDPGGQIGSLVESMLNNIKKYYDSLASYKATCDTFTQCVKDVYDAKADFRSDLEQAAQAIAYASTFSKDLVPEQLQIAKYRIEKVVAGLTTKNSEGKAKFEESASKTALVSLLNATVSMMSGPGPVAPRPASYNPDAPPPPPEALTVPTLSGTDVSLFDQVRKIVQKPGYFHPGTDSKVFACMSACFAPWGSTSDVAKRKEMILALVGKIGNVAVDKYKEVASELARVKYSVTGRT